MKKLLSYLNIAALLIAMSAMFAACTDKDSSEDALGLSIKVFAPTVVVPGTAMTINGTGLGDVTEIQFPGDITVTDFEIVTDEMIRVKAPAGLTKGGNIAVVNAAGETAVSRLPLSVGQTQITGFYPIAEGDEIPTLKGNETLTVYGKDMQFIAGAEFIDEDGNPIYVPASEFLRVANGRVVIQVPAKVLTGTATVKIYLADGTCVESPEYAFEPASNGGHWETVKRCVWEKNDGPNVSWSGDYRFCEVGHDFNNECIAELPSEDWAAMKTGEFYVDLESAAPEGPQIRVTTGWWSVTWTGDDIFPGNDRLADLGDGKYTLTVDLTGDPILDAIDEQHLLLTGDRYKPTAIYFLEQQWVEGEEGHFETVRTSFWKNGEQSTIPAPNWSGEGRFSNVETTTGEETYAFPMDIWEKIKTEPFRIAIEITNPDWQNIRVTTGWWSTNYMGMENLMELIEQDEAGNNFIEINLANDPALQEAVDQQHLLFTGDGYKLLEIYQETEVWVGGEAGPQDIVIWEKNDGPNVSWSGDYRFCEVGHDFNSECIAEFESDAWEVIKNGTFYVDLESSAPEGPQIRVTTGWWSTTWTGDDIFPGNEKLTELGDGKYTLEVNLSGDAILDAIDEQHFLLTGDRYKPTRIYYKK